MFDEVFTKLINFKYELDLYFLEYNIISYLI
jgi:hypothetical protein